MIVGFGGTHVSAYDYPLKDPYAATIAGTPTESRATAAREDRLRNSLGLEVFPRPPRARCAIGMQRGILYTLSYQKQEAPLIFATIAGTGSSSDLLQHDLSLQKAF